MSDTRAIRITSVRRCQRSCRGALQLVSLMAVIGCSGAEWSDVQEEGEVDTLSQALVPANNSWRGWDRVSDLSGHTDNFIGNPAVCVGKTGGSDGLLVVGRDPTTNGYLSASFWRSWSGAFPEPPGVYPEGYWLDSQGYVHKPRWQRLGTNMTFNDDAACTSLSEPGYDDNLNHQVAVAGKYKRNNQTSSNDNKYYVRTMLVDTVYENGYPGDDTEHATLVDNWFKISDDVYASAPAIAVAGGALLVVGRRSDNRLYIHRNLLNLSNTTAPYDHNDWEPAIQVPALPSSWVATGKPQIVSTVALNGWDTLMVRATSGSQARLYYIMWNGNWFTAWMHLATPSNVVSSDPALEIDVGGGSDALNLLTVYFRGAVLNSNGSLSGQNRVYQTSGTSFSPQSWSPVRLACPADPETFPTSASPSAAGSGTFEGRHIVTMRDTDNQFYQCLPTPGIPIGP